MECDMMRCDGNSVRRKGVCVADGKGFCLIVCMYVWLQTRSEREKRGGRREEGIRGE